MSPQRIAVLNGPNLGRLGRREPETYGRTTHAELAQMCLTTAAELGIDVEVRQTDAEHEMLAWLHQAADHGTPVILNAGAWTHYSHAIGDACAMLRAPLVELHISNVARRENFRHYSVVSPHATAVVAGLGVAGYPLALRWLAGEGQTAAG